MAIRRKVEQIVDNSESKKEYFSSKYSIGKVADLKVGKEVYCIPLGVQEGFYEVWRHRVETRAPEKGFRGKYPTWIKCKGRDDEGNPVEGATCCELVTEQFKKFPGEDEYNKRLIKKASKVTYIPVLVLGYAGVDKDALKVPVNKLTMKNYSFAYLELSDKAYHQSFMAPLISRLKDDGIIDYELAGEELRAEAAKYLQKCLIKVSAVTSQSPKVKYEKAYSFTLFTNKNIGAASDQYKYITNYNKIAKVNNDIVDFMTLFDTEVDNICLDWTEEDLIKYINVDGERSQRIEEATKETKVKEIPAKEEQVVTIKEETEDIEDDDEFEIMEDIEEDIQDSIEQDKKVANNNDTLELDDDLMSMEIDEDFIDMPDDDEL